VPSSLQPALDLAVAAAREAGDLLRAELHRPGGPRGAVDKAPADEEAEILIRGRLLAGTPGAGYLGEETGAVSGRPGAPVWVVDPNDGTREFLKSRRGSSVSIALLVDGVPRLGVVYAFAFPDDGGDLFAWAEGTGPLTRNGRPVEPWLPEILGPEDVVLLAVTADLEPEAILACVNPARFRTVPSVAHRLALVAAGEGAAAVALHGPRAWDYAGGHALLRGAGAALVDEQGREVRYAADGRSRCVHALGGRAGVVRDLATSPWPAVPAPFTPGGAPEVAPVFRGRLEADPGRLGRAQGCLLGQVAGDSLGGLVEFSSGEAIRAAHADGPRRLTDGGHWQTLAGQPTDDSEMALALARSIVAHDGFRRDGALAAYRDWLRSAPFDVGRTVRAALRDHTTPSSQANGSLMRASPLGIHTHVAPPPVAAELARQDASLTHPNPVCGDATAAFVVAVAHAVRHGDGTEAAWNAAREWARSAGAMPQVQESLDAARHEAPVCDRGQEGWVKIALQNAFFELLHAESVEDGVVSTVRRGGDTDTNAAIAGALLGAVHGREAVPGQWRSMVLSCRPVGPRARRPRPATYWPVGVMDIAERLLTTEAPGAGR
jgi:ADP-ribosyl-[dinitrogen reductase] hydrolase